MVELLTFRQRGAEPGTSRQPAATKAVTYSSLIFCRLPSQKSPKKLALSFGVDRGKGLPDCISELLVLLCISSPSRSTARILFSSRYPCIHRRHGKFPSVISCLSHSHGGPSMNCRANIGSPTVFVQSHPDFRGGHHRREGRKCPSQCLRRRHRRR